MALEPQDDPNADITHGDAAYEPEPPQSNRGALVALGVVAMLILGGLWLMHVLGAASSTQDCIASGRTNCAPVAAGSN